MSENLGPVIGLLCGGFFVLIFAGVGGLLIYQSIRSRKKAETSQSWPATSGQITDAHVSHHTSTDSDGDTRDHYSPKVSYTYQVAGQSYEGNKIEFGIQQSYGNSSKAQAALTRFPVGAQISVFYDPNNPADAVLERKAGGSNVTLMIGVVFLVIGLCLGCPGLTALLIASLTST